MKNILWLGLLLASIAQASVVYPPIVCSADGSFYGKSGGVMGCYAPTGGGDMSGAGSSVAHNLSSFADASGALLEDSGVANNNLCLLTGNQTVAGIKSFSSAPVLSALSASLPVCTGAGKAASSTCTGLIPWADIVTGNNYRLIATGAAGVPAEAAAITAARVLISDANGIPTHSTVTSTTLGFLDVASSLTTLLAAKLPATGVGLVDSHRGHIYGTVADGTYVLDEYAEYAYTINRLTTKLSAGTVTVAIKINGTNVTGISAHSATTSQVQSTASAANAVVVGDRVTLVTASGASDADLSYTLKYTR